MIVFFLVLLFIKSEIPDYLKPLANEAIKNSKNRIKSSQSINSAYPGEYSFQNAKFTLKRTLSTSNTKDIKGYAIENENVVIVKRKNYNLQENLVFVDPNSQNFYNMERLIAFDDKVNIYSTTNLTLFDVMTNFNYHAKTEKATTPSINLNWDTSRDGPELKQLPHVAGFEYGLGAVGEFTIDTHFRFKSASDISLGASIKVDIKAAAELQFHDGTFEGSEDLVLFELPPIPIKQLGFKIEFLGIKLTIQPYIKCDALLKNIRFSVPSDVAFLKGYNIIGFKNIEITPNSIVNSKWYISVMNLPEKNNIDEIIEQLKQAQIKFTPALRLYLSIEVDLAGISTNFDFGLQIPFEFTFQFQPEKCLFPYLYGDLEIKFQMFYYFDGITITFGKNSLTLIEDSTDSFDFKSIKTEKFCIGESSKVYEGNQLYIQTSYDRMYYIHHSDIFWNRRIDFGPVQIVSEIYDESRKKLLAKGIHPFVKYNIVPSPCYSHLIIRASETIQPFYYLYQYENAKLTRSDGTYSRYFDNSSLYCVDNIPINYKNMESLNINLNAYNCKEIQYNKIFSKEPNSVVIAKIPCYKYDSFVLLSINKYEGTQIDNGATFYIVTMSSNANSEPGIVYASSNHYEIKFYSAYCDVPMFLDVNISFKKTENGRRNTYDFGGISQEFVEKEQFLFEKSDLTNQIFMFYAPQDENPELSVSCKFTFFHSNGKPEELTMNRIFDYEKIRKCADNEAPEELFGQFYGQFVIKIERINEPMIAINSSITSEHNMLIRCHDVLMKFIIDSFDLNLDNDEVYFAIRFKPDGFVLKNNYIVLICKEITPLVKDLIKLSSDAYLIKCTEEKMTVAFRRTNSNAENLFFMYLISDLNDPNDINIKKEGEIVELAPNERKGFVVPAFNGKVHTLRIDQNGNEPDSAVSNSILIDSETWFISIGNNSPDENMTIDICLCYDVIEDGQYMISSYIGYLQNIIRKHNSKSFDFFVYTTSNSITAIRCGNVVKSINNNRAIFTFGLDFNDTVDFYAVCSNETMDMCEITLNVTEGEYQLVRFPNRDGLNITGRGMKTAIIHTPNASSFSYYKTFKGPIEILRSYNDSINIKVFVKDVENPNKNDEPDLITEYPSQFDSNISNSFNFYLEKEITYRGPYREFCIKDDDNDIALPFSLKYFSENISDFMKSIGAIDDFDATHYGITENDCIFVYKEALKSNTFNDLPPNIIDMDVDNENVQIDSSDATFIFDKKKKINLVAIIVPIVLVVILIVVGVFVFIYLRNKKKNVSEKENNADGNETSTL